MIKFQERKIFQKRCHALYLQNLTFTLKKPHTHKHTYICCMAFWFSLFPNIHKQNLQAASKPQKTPYLSHHTQPHLTCLSSLETRTLRAIRRSRSSPMMCFFSATITWKRLRSGNIFDVEYLGKNKGIQKSITTINNFSYLLNFAIATLV